MRTSPLAPGSPVASPYAKHVPALDGLRGTAILLVLGYHLFPATARSPVMHALQHLLDFGANGVDLFFVLSGFLITGILYDSQEDLHFFRNFYARRVLRIFPLYYGVLLVYTLGALLFGARFDHQLWSMALYLQNTYIVAQPIFFYHGPTSLPLVHFWTLAVEEQFYLFWPVIVFYLRTKRNLLTVCLGFALLCPLLRIMLWQQGTGYYAVHMRTLLRADSLLAGAALALLLRHDLHDATLRSAPWLLMIASLAGSLLLLAPALQEGRGSLWAATALSLRYTTANVAFVGLIGMSLQAGLAATVFRSAALRWLGKYSYGIYVLHYPLFAYLQRPLRALIEEHITRNKGAGVVLDGSLIAALSLVIAYASFHLYEKRFLRLKRRFSYSVRPGAPA